ncbi:MarC family protein [Luteibacter sp. 3190]|uniref:MarC family protein n=1 Tax=Luteibacter sp. 3190 TaxID=2817736 RepID=UPI0028612252|nr:MarC family protein [Luteibacter sp. 3190]MDR6935627.1 multiple antibiotic resistance protein [Luteibacter sp. 3190]
MEIGQATLVIVAALLPVVNPPGSALMSLGVVPHADAAERERLARNVALNSLLLLLGSLLLGAYVLSFFGISIPVLRVAGGIVIAAAGWRMLNGQDDDDDETEVHHHRGDPSFYPLTLPLTVGPGSISVAIAIGTGSPRQGAGWIHVVAAAIALAALTVSIYLCMRYADRLSQKLGAQRTQVVLQLLAFVIFCIGIQLFWAGLSELIGLHAATTT